MAATVLTTMRPVRINSTVLATANMRWSPGITESVIKHSGNPFPSSIVRSSIAPSLTFETPLDECFDLIGGFNKTLDVTVCDAYLQTFTDYARDANADVWELQAGARASAMITGIGEGAGGIMMATVVVSFLSSDGLAAPFDVGTPEAFPTLSAEPTYHIRGPCVINGNRISGVRGISVDLGNQMVGGLSDGDVYPRNAPYEGGQPVIRISHGSPKSVLAEIGLDGTARTGTTEVYFRLLTNYVAQATGFRLAVALGSIIPEDISQQVGAVDTTGIMIKALSVDGAEPLTPTASTALPAA